MSNGTKDYNGAHNDNDVASSVQKQEFLLPKLSAFVAIKMTEGIN